MKKWLLFLLATPALAQSAIVTGKIQTYNPGIAPNALGNYVEFALTNCGNNTPMVNGTAVLLSKPIDFYPDSTGALSAAANGGITPALYGNDIINCGGAFTSRYSVRYFVGGVAQGPAKFYFIPSTAPFNLTSATPIGLQPPLSPPYPNLTTCAPGSYSNGLNPDLSVKCLNLPGAASNAVVVNPTATQEIANQPLVLDGPLTGSTATFATTNGVFNAATCGSSSRPSWCSGGDIGAWVNAAFAQCVTSSSNCKVMIPAGSYSYNTGIVLSGLSNTGNTELNLSAGAILTYSGNSYGIKTTTNPGGLQGHFAIRGGVLLGTSAAKGGVLLAPGVNGTVVEGMIINGFSAGDCILDAGTNAAQIRSNKVSGCLVGFHDFGVPGYASNNLLVEGNAFAGNLWGIIDGDMSQWPSGTPSPFGGTTTGVSSPMYGNTFIANDLESNSAGAAMEGLTVGTTYQGNYVEGNPRGIVLGETEQPLNASQLSFLYGRTSTNGGTTKDPTVRSNFFTTGSSIHDLIELRATGFATIDGNSTDTSSGPSACFMDLFTGTSPWVGQNETANVTTELCQGGSPGWTLVNQLPISLSVAGNGVFTGTLSSGPLTQTGMFTLNQGTGFSGGSIGPSIGTMGPIVIFTTLTAPGGACTPGFIDIGAFGFAVCQSGTWVTK